MTDDAAPRDEKPSSKSSPPERHEEAPDDEGTDENVEAPEGRRPRREPLDADGMARPRFLLDFPEDPELERLIAAFESGNYAFVREHAPRLAERAADPAVRDAARELRRRIEPDPLARYLLVASILLLVFLVTWTYLGHDH
jgi:hypothetical protein